MDGSDERLPELYLDAVELDEPARAALLRRLRSTDPVLAEELERLLAAPESAPSPIDASPLMAAGLDPEADAVPRRVGPYRIERELGRGGMGRVFLAEHETPDFRRTVALKLIDRPGSGESAIRRFRDEVRILASLDHPGIVRFLDGGRSAEGIWYLAQEYVEGTDLLTHARRERLSIAQRVALFRAVLDPVEWAHSRGVVHRDLKPANLLVGPDGRPRLLDFGISKLIDPAAGSGDGTTLTETRALTPAYASPEQWAGRPASAASDLYSLGVVLYELLVGARPSDAASASDPEPPSSAARRLAATAAPAAGRAGARSRDALRGLGSDLDAICLKALRREPEARYASAAELSDDLQRYLDGRPVAARRGGLRYRATRFARRYRGRVTTAAALAVALASIAVAVVVHDSARVRPVAPEAFPFSHLRTMLIEDLQRRFVAAPEDVGAGAALALGLAGKGRLDEAQILVERLRQIPGRERDPLIDYTDATIAVERDELQRALVLFTRARDGAIAEGRGELVGQIRAARGSALLMLGEPADAAAEMELAAGDFERAGDDASLGRVLGDLAVVHLIGGERGHAEELLIRSVDASERAGARPVAALCNLAELEVQRGRPDLAAPRLERVIELYAQSGDERRRAQREIDLSEALRDLGRVAEADLLLGRAIEVLGRTAPDSPALAAGLFQRARVDLAAGRTDAVPAAIEAVERIARSAADTRTLALAHSLRARLAVLGGDPGTASGHFAEAHRLLGESGDADLAGELDLDWAEAERDAGRPEEAVRVLEAAREALGGSGETAVAYLGEALRARIEAEGGDLEAARRRLAPLAAEAERSPSLGRRLAFLTARARLAAAEGRIAEARADLEAALAVARLGGRELEARALELELAAATVPPARRPA